MPVSMSERVRRKILVQGTVQGVGFRPFVYRTALHHGLAGFVRNLGDAGVEIEVEGQPHKIEQFVDDLLHRAPPLARVAHVEQYDLVPLGKETFQILPSKDGGEGQGTIPPDVATCSACVEDIFSPQSRFHRYWATSCTDCGPRFTVIEGLPYDRPRTAFRDFPFCPSCEREYKDPADRRYHAQTIACPVCGPRLRFVREGREVEGDPVQRAVDALKGGEIVAIKGLGGTHLACDATREEVVAELRRRLGRPGQPFALMAREDLVEKFAAPTAQEWELLRSFRRPIVVLPQRQGYLAPSVAPGLHTVGVMLPYTGLHHLLFEQLDFPLVMTSANFPGRPMLIADERILAELAGVADSFLLHNRRIVARCDDSVVRVAARAPVFLRRSRGWVPEPIPVDLGEEPLLALGGDLNVTVGVYHRGQAHLSQHIGNTEHVETEEFLVEALQHLLRLLHIPQPRNIACDLHPRFATSRLAQQLGEPIPVQHHVAHVAGLAAEHGLSALVGIAADGYGYGLDGQAWGGEVILWREGKFERKGSLRPVPLPGGDLATLRPGRMAASFLQAAGLDPRASGLSQRELQAVLLQIDRQLNCPFTTGAGRFLDAVAAWLGICRERTYEGEPAMKLEAAAARGRPLGLTAPIVPGPDRLLVDTVALFRGLAEAREQGARPHDIAATAQEAMARGLAEVAVHTARTAGVEDIGLTGGVAVNHAIAATVQEVVEKAGFRFRSHRAVPPGDGGLAFGQLAQAAWLLRPHG